MALRDLFANTNTNSTSRVLALRNDESGEVVLLTGDSTQDELKLAMTTLVNVNNLYRIPFRKFRCIKVSHHGAKSCHVNEIYENHCDARKSIAIICASDDGLHPHPEVKQHISRFVKDCRITGWCQASSYEPKKKRGIPLGHKRSEENFEDIHVAFKGANVEVFGGRKS
jgi:hypothetical protein